MIDIKYFDDLVDDEKLNIVNKIKELYCVKNLSLNEVCEILNFKKTSLRVLFRRYNIRKTNEQAALSRQRVCKLNTGYDSYSSIPNVKEKRRKTMNEKFGYDCNLQLPEIRQKVQDNCLKNYGVLHHFLRDDVKQKSKKTCKSKEFSDKLKNIWLSRDEDSKKIIGNKISNTLKNRTSDEIQIANMKSKQTRLKKYGNENYVNIEKIKQTNLTRYGFEFILQSPDIRKRIEQTCLEKYGYKQIMQSPDFREKIEQINLDKYGHKCVLSNMDVQNKIKSTMLQRYGVIHPIQSTEIKEKILHTCEERYGRHRASQSHISNESYNIISNEYLFKNFIINIDYVNRTPYKLAQLLEINQGLINVYIRKYDCQHLINYKASHYEQDIQSYFNDLHVYTFLRDRKTIKPQEMDLFIPEFNFGIEFNGNYYHCVNSLNKIEDINKRGNELYHQNKSLKAKEKGIFIYHIFEYEWNDERKREIIKSQLRNLCHKNENKIYARNCEIKEVKDNKLIRQFLDENHLQGYRSSKIKLGLFYNDELVSLMTFGKPYLSKSNKYEWELYRFCNKLNTSVIGGFNKLFKYFIKNYNPQSILTYSDFAKGNGNVYEKIGFKQLELTKPNYVWWNKDEILTRYQTQMKDEVKVMEEQGFLRIFDCGNYKWVWNKENNI